MSLVALGRILLIITILELSLGGGGRLIDTGPVSLRMVLFGMGLIYTAGVIFHRLPFSPTSVEKKVCQ